MESVRGWPDQPGGPVRAGLHQGGKGEDPDPLSFFNVNLIFCESLLLFKEVSFNFPTLSRSL